MTIAMIILTMIMTPMRIMMMIMVILLMMMMIIIMMMMVIMIVIITNAAATYDDDYYDNDADHLCRGDDNNYNNYVDDSDEVEKDMGPVDDGCGEHDETARELL